MSSRQWKALWEGGARGSGTEASPDSERGRRRRALVGAAGLREVRTGLKETSCQGRIENQKISFIAVAATRSQ